MFKSDMYRNIIQKPNSGARLKIIAEFVKRASPRSSGIPLLVMIVNAMQLININKKNAPSVLDLLDRNFAYFNGAFFRPNKM
ncbi:hypothetical protein D3C72_2265090 [compost metagenome]